MESQPQKVTARHKLENLSNAIKELSDTQKANVRDMGFSVLLEMEEMQLPPDLTSWLYSVYDHEKSVIKINDTTDLEISKQSVRTVFGFLMGDTPVKIVEKSSLRMIKTWKNQYDSALTNITVISVIEQMAKQKNGGLHFKLNFLVAVFTILGGGGTSSGYANRRCLAGITDVDHVSKMDWCTYTLHYLKTAKKDYMEKAINKNSEYKCGGPLALLVLFYVHTTRIRNGVTVDTSRSPICVWNTNLLLEREDAEMKNGGFGINLDKEKSLPVYVDEIEKLDLLITREKQHRNDLIDESVKKFPKDEKLKRLKAKRYSPQAENSSAEAETTMRSVTKRKSVEEQKKMKRMKHEMEMEENIQKEIDAFTRPKGRPPNENDPYRPITKEEVSSVARVLSSSDRQEDLKISLESLHRLKPTERLNSEVINYYFELLKEREETETEPQQFLKCHFFPTFFYTKLTQKNGYDCSSVTKWTEKLEYRLSHCDKIFVPVHKEASEPDEEHWCLGVINILKKKFEYLDSVKQVGGYDTKVLNVLAKFFKDEVENRDGPNTIDITKWKKETFKGLPQQNNGYDCGMFMIKYADFSSIKSKTINFTHDCMRYFRIKDCVGDTA